MTLFVVLLAAATMVGLGLVMTLILGWANRAFHVEVDPKVELVNDALPGANCGGCGYVGCMEYAEAVALNGEAVNKCAPGGEACASAVAGIMGVAVEKSWPYRAVIHCAAGCEDKLGRNEYRGERSCASANVISGVQGCTYGCLGFGDCQRACDFDAIHVEDDLARVDYHKCTGCGACARVCPRNIITMVPFKSDRMLVAACSNVDSALEVRKVCTVGCIGCKACEKMEEMFEIVDNLAKIDYDKYDQEDVEGHRAVIKKCPREALVFVGKPSEKDLEAVAGEQLPERIEADFKTTADDAEWRG